MNNLQLLHNKYNQSPWLDNISRDLLQNGGLKKYLDEGIRGVTSNPTILENAIKNSSLYDEQIRELASHGASTEDIYWRIVMDDIKAAAKMLRPLYDESGGEDGYISLEVSPLLAHDRVGTINQARWIWEEINEPNLMIKVPATNECIPAVYDLLKDGINVNVTLIFSLDHYNQVAQAHLAAHKDSDTSARSVASFFISRVDTKIDERLHKINTPEALKLTGKSAVAQARIAYDIFLKHSAEIATLEPYSPAIQRLLWASTSTKNPDYNDLLYVTGLLAPFTVNTLPEATIEKILDHLSTDTPSLSMYEIEEAKITYGELANVGIDRSAIARELAEEGVSSFEASFASLMSSIEEKARSN